MSHDVLYKDYTRKMMCTNNIILPDLRMKVSLLNTFEIDILNEQSLY